MALAEDRGALCSYVLTFTPPDITRHSAQGGEHPISTWLWKSMEKLGGKPSLVAALSDRAGDDRSSGIRGTRGGKQARRAIDWQLEGREFEPPRLHQEIFLEK